MPTYPYTCTECGHAFEVHQSFSDPSLTECPECSGRLRKVFSSVGVVFKGSGFYRTDSRSGSGGSVTGGSGASGGSGGSDGAGTKSDPASATKSGSDAGAKTTSTTTTSTSATPAAAAGS